MQHADARVTEHTLVRLVDALGEDRLCAHCGVSYRANETGALLCRYHPFNWVSRGQRSMPYLQKHMIALGDERSFAPTHCETCNTQHLTGDARFMQHQNRVPGIRAANMAKIGCVALDHSSEGVASVLRRPFIAAPFFIATRFLIADPHYKHTFSHRNTIIVDSPQQLNLCLRVVIPGDARPFLHPVRHIYCEMAQIYNLGDLDSDVRLARRGPNASSITRIHKSANNDERLEVHRLHGTGTERTVSFTPFVIIVRIAQPTDVCLIDRPDLVHIVGDDQLI